jgi:NADH:ubiquinone oxidoreductase subunit H
MEKTTQLQALADLVIARVFDMNPHSWALTELVYVIFMFAAAGLAFGFALNFAGLFIFFERRIAARMQSRVGPNRVGPNGVIQWAVDGIKCLFKEDLIPNGADKALFRMAPYFVVLGMVLSFACLPFTSALIPSDLNIGILFILGVTSLVVIGVLMGGWGSNSKWALLGGMRAAAQVVSYEIPAALAAMSVIIVGGSLSMQDLIKVQGGNSWLPNWTIFHSPFTFVAFLVFFVAQLAEGNRTPFDLPEAESELVSGYNTEYSGMRFLMFFLGEFANVWVMAAISVTLFLGGWQIPMGTMDDGITPSPWVTSGSGVILAVMMVGAAFPALLIGRGIFKYRGRAHAAIMRAKVPAGASSTLLVWLIVSVAALTAGVVYAIVPEIWTALGPPRWLPSPPSLALAMASGASVIALAMMARYAWLRPEIMKLLLRGAVDGAMGGHLFGAFALVGLAFLQLGTSNPTWVAVREPIAINGLQLGIFAAKSLALVFVVIQLRWTLPRLRVDQMMTLCWKYLVPLSFACMVGTLVWELLIHSVPALNYLMRWAMLIAGIWLAYVYVRKIKATYDIDRDRFETHYGEPAYYPPWKLP